jgi:TP901 family phage tail tape measure protein
VVRTALICTCQRTSGDALVDARTKYGMLNYAIGQIAQNTINWGKNTQWAGRQLTAGISMPLAIAAAQLTSLSNQTDQQLTKITKVYNTQATPGADPVQQQISNQQQLAKVRQDSYQTGIDMAKQYGAALQQTLGTEADLAAIGKTGQELQRSTAEITRISTLGELDHNTAMQMSISLMSAFKQNADQLGDSFNYINAIENATSLTTQDFAEAIPRAGAALAATGVSLQQFGVLMTAMKEGGVNADQGANALKSAMSRILTPTAAARTEFAKMKINIDEVVRDAKGNLFVILEELGKRMQGVDEMTKQTALKDLFGTYQVNRLDVALNGVSESLAGVSTQASQTAQAVAIMNQGSTSWAQTADQEIKQLNDSISQKFKKAVETMKAEFAQAGMPILQVLTKIINLFDGVLNWFNNSPSLAKDHRRLGCGLWRNPRSGRYAHRFVCKLVG